MQGRQNQAMDLMELEKLRLMFPEGCGYRSETGGLMEALRILDVQTIRE
jgi:Zn-dependent M16 (insulinase) family peptidase